MAAGDGLVGHGQDGNVGEFGPDALDEALRIGGAARLGDAHAAGVRFVDVLDQVVGQGPDGGLAAHGLIRDHDAAFLVPPQDGLDVEDGGDDRLHAGDAAAPLQVHEIVHGEDLHHVGPEPIQLPQDLLDIRARLLELLGRQHQQPLPQGRAPGVEGFDAPVGVLLPHLTGRQDRGPVGPADAGGHADIEHVVACGGLPLEDLPKGFGIDHGGGGRAARLQVRVVFLVGEGFRVQAALLRPAVVDEVKGHHADPQLLTEGRRQVGRGIRPNAKGHF